MGEEGKQSMQVKITSCIPTHVLEQTTGEFSLQNISENITHEKVIDRNQKIFHRCRFICQIKELLAMAVLLCTPLELIVYNWYVLPYSTCLTRYG